MSSIPNGKFVLGLTPQDVTDVHSAIQLITTRLLPALCDLNADQRRKLLKLGDASASFSPKTYNYTVENQNMKPPFIDMADYTQTVNDYQTVADMQHGLAQVVNQLGDTLMLLGSQKLTFDLACYRGFQAAADMNVPGADLIVTDLAPRFAGQGRTKVTTQRKARKAAKPETPDDKPDTSDDKA